MSKYYIKIIDGELEIQDESKKPVKLKTLKGLNGVDVTVCKTGTNKGALVLTVAEPEATEGRGRRKGNTQPGHASVSARPANPPDLAGADDVIDMTQAARPESDSDVVDMTDTDASPAGDPRVGRRRTSDRQAPSQSIQTGPRPNKWKPPKSVPKEKDDHKYNDNVELVPRERPPARRYKVRCIACQRVDIVSVIPTVEGERVMYRCDGCCKVSRD